MKYKLVFCDFDGTLLRSDRTASKETIEAIKEYRSKGGIFIISTGRMFESIIGSLRLIGLDGVNMPVSAMDGGIIKESITQKTIALHTMPYGQVSDFARECENMGLYFQVYTKDSLIVAEENEINRNYCAITKVVMNKVGILSKFIEHNKLECVKVLIADKNVEKYLKYFDGKYKDIQFFLSAKEYLDGASVFAGKGNALKALASELNIDLEDTMAIGDSMNDISMVETAGVGIAMGNADERLKKIASFIAPSNDDDGVAKIIRKITYDEDFKTVI